MSEASRRHTIKKIILGYILGLAMAAGVAFATANPEPSVGLYWYSNSDPTVPPGVNAPQFQLLIRTDTQAIYWKSGSSNEAWTKIAGTGAGGSVTSITCGANGGLLCSPNPITTTGTISVAQLLTIPNEQINTETATELDDYDPWHAGPHTSRVEIDPTQPTLLVTGIVAGTDGDMLWLWNGGNGGGNPNWITLPSQSASSSALNRFWIADGKQVNIPNNDGVLLIYDGAFGWTCFSCATSILRAQEFSLDPASIPAALTPGTYNNYNPFTTSFGTTSYIRQDITGPGTAEITGIVAAGAPNSDGRLLVIENISTSGGIIQLDNANGGSTGPNQILTQTGGSITIGDQQSITLMYDTTEDAYRVVSYTGPYSPGIISPTFALTPHATPTALPSLPTVTEDWNPNTTDAIIDVSVNLNGSILGGLKFTSLCAADGEIHTLRNLFGSSDTQNTGNLILAQDDTGSSCPFHLVGREGSLTVHTLGSVTVQWNASLGFWFPINNFDTPNLRSILPATLPATTVNNWNPVDATTGLSYQDTTWIEVTPSVGTVLTGILPTVPAGSRYGQQIKLTNVGPAFTLAHSSGLSSTNFTMATGNDYIMVTGSSVTMTLDDTSNTWWVDTPMSLVGAGFTWSGGLLGNDGTLYTTAGGAVSGSMTAGTFNQIGGVSGPSWTSGASAPTGVCTTGSTYSVTTSSANPANYVCADTSWTNVVTGVVEKNVVWFGPGSDGTVTFDGTSTVLGLVPAGSVYTLTRDIVPANMTVNVGVTIKTANYMIAVDGTLTNNGTISNDGQAGAAGSGGNTTPAGRFPINITGGQTGGTGGGSSHGPVGFFITATGAAGGGAGTNGTNGTNGAGTGGGGGGATSSSGSTGGAQTVGTLVPSFDDFLRGAHTPDNVALSFGTGGGAGGNGSSVNGFGGAGGSIVFIAAKTIAGTTGAIHARGGNGGTAVASDNAGGGGGGGGGMVVVVYNTGANTNTIDANGGTGGNGSTGDATGKGGNGGTGVLYELNLSGDGT